MEKEQGHQPLGSIPESQLDMFNFGERWTLRLRLGLHAGELTHTKLPIGFRNFFDLGAAWAWFVFFWLGLGVGNGSMRSFLPLVRSELGGSP